MQLKNWTLLAKWRFGEEKWALWRRVIVSKYGEDKRGWVPKGVPRYRLSGLWAVFSSFGDVSNKRRVVFQKGLGFIVGEGETV